MYERDIILQDLKQSVIEFFFKDFGGNKFPSIKCTHRPELMPKSFINEQHLMDQFHNENPNTIAAWNIDARTWSSIDINNVQYTQVVDTY